MDVRYDTDELARVEIYGTDTNSSARLKNLSYGGANLMYNDEIQLESGDLVRVTIYLDSLNKRYSINGEIRWVHHEDERNEFRNRVSSPTIKFLTSSSIKPISKKQNTETAVVILSESEGPRREPIGNMLRSFEFRSG